MNRVEIDSMVVALMQASRNPRTGGLYKALGRRLRAAAEKYGAVAPFGKGNGKTDAPGTYRPVGATCPDSCPYLDNGCFAQTGNVNLHQRRAGLMDTDAHLRAVVCAFVWGRLLGMPARLHVSGGMGKTPDPYYMMGLREAALSVAEHIEGDNIVAWTYTAHSEEAMGIWLLVLGSAGISVRVSSKAGPRGAVVWPFADLPMLKGAHAGLRTIRCREQLEDVTCVECTLCWTKPEHTIIFDPIGARRKRAEAATRTHQGVRP